MYNTFECHFKPNQKSQSDMVDPVGLMSYFTMAGFAIFCSEMQMNLHQNKINY